MSYILDALKRAEAQRERGHVPGLHSQTTPLSTAPAHTTRPPLWSLALIMLLGSGLVAMLLRPSTTLQAPATPMTEKPTVARTTETIENTITTAMVAAPPTLKPPVKSTPAPIASASAVRPTAVKGLMTPAPVQAASATTPAPVVDLTEELRRQLPALQITGAIYSDNPSQRLLLVNGLVLPQNSAINPELVLEEIGPRSSIFRFRGTRFKVNH